MSFLQFSLQIWSQPITYLFFESSSWSLIKFYIHTCVTFIINGLVSINLLRFRVDFPLSTFCIIWKHTIFVMISILNFFKKQKYYKDQKQLLLTPILFLFFYKCLDTQTQSSIWISWQKWCAFRSYRTHLMGNILKIPLLKTHFY